jgi:hypothetical protein
MRLQGGLHAARRWPAAIAPQQRRSLLEEAADEPTKRKSILRTTLWVFALSCALPLQTAKSVTLLTRPVTGAELEETTQQSLSLTSSAQGAAGQIKDVTGYQTPDEFQESGKTYPSGYSQTGGYSAHGVEKDPFTGAPKAILTGQPATAAQSAAAYSRAVQLAVDYLNKYGKQVPGPPLGTVEQMFYFELTQGLGIVGVSPVPIFIMDPQNGYTAPFRTRSASTSATLGADLSRNLDFDANQRLIVFGAFTFSNFWTKAPSVREWSEGQMVGGALGATWRVDANYITASGGLNGGAVGNKSSFFGNWGSRNFGGGADVAAGHAFSFWFSEWLPDSQLAQSEDGWRLPAVLLDASTHVGYWGLHGYGFADGMGIFWGSQNCRAAVTGVSAKISLPYLGEQALVAPYLRGAFDYSFDRAQTTLIPAQVNSVPDQIDVYGIPRTIVRVEAGVSALSPADLLVEVAVNYALTPVSRGYGGRVSLHVPIAALFEGKR